GRTRGAEIVSRGLIPPSMIQDPIADFCGAISCSTVVFEERCKALCSSSRASKDRNIDWSVGAKCTIFNVNLGDGCLVVDEVAVPHGPHIQRTTEGDDEICLRDEVSRRR